jgi:hypothetical protein
LATKARINAYKICWKLGSFDYNILVVAIDEAVFFLSFQTLDLVRFSGNKKRGNGI